MANRFVQKLQGYADLTATEILALEQATIHPRKLAAKHDLIREGDRPGPVFVMLEGWAFRYKILPSGTRQIMAFLMPGDCCDLHIGLLAEMDHSIQTVSSARVAMIPRAEMDRLMSEHGGIARAMYIAQLADEGTLRAWIVSMGRRSSLERVAHLMCELYVRGHAISLESGNAFALPLSQIMLADALGMTPVHINRILKQLRLTGAMQLRRGSVNILAPAKLAQIAGFDENYLHRRMRRPSSRTGISSGPESSGLKDL
ncbi:Crp/Fnr family transcriptional regulator [Sphingomonas oligoaromativorans]|uniref:Crp/Fnr family transcriptional regulator n=1 Tax=Sphingomonas oligoaromativorans TaxID=575322 RepID=UPI00141D7797|nr:Crp/Fnr family transcriptional regulator [Sphingomonas oligoaromativorans]NIJ35309.1 CRP-like cAMP-binding protein [Sphingomonas oligoaromativorans]